MEQRLKNKNKNLTVACIHSVLKSNSAQRFFRCYKSWLVDLFMSRGGGGGRCLFPINKAKWKVREENRLRHFITPAVMQLIIFESELIK